MVDFGNLGLKSELVDVLNKIKIKEPTEVQREIIPQIFSGKNTIFSSRTGSGKTYVYLLGCISKIVKKNGLQMVIVVPSTELCIQIGKEIKKVCDALNIVVGMTYGGRSSQGDYKTLDKKNNILVGTPGRLIEHINSKKLRVGTVRFLVYDESDKMLDEGFYKECLYIKSRVSSSSQIILSSATISDKINRFVERELSDYEIIKVGEAIPEKIKQYRINCKRTEKPDLLLKIIERNKFKRIMIFCNTKICAEYVQDLLNSKKLSSGQITSNLNLKERLNILNLFKDRKLKILISTDVLARGIHINKVNLVINYDVPIEDEFYIHRIGRTARLDKSGTSITFVSKTELSQFDEIEKKFDLKIEILEN